jgi:hypothetical protein
METKLVNSQLVSRKDVKVWFWDGEREFSGDCRAIAENGIWIEAKAKRPADGTILDARSFLSSVKRAILGKSMTVEMSSPRTKGEVKVRFDQVDVVSTKKEIFSIIASFASPPNPELLKMILAPVVTHLPKKPSPPPPK